MGLWLVAGSVLAGGKEIGQPLFVIERSLNANSVHYDANLMPNGELDPRQPVAAYWVMADENGRREELTGIEKRYAYGFTVAPSDNPRRYRLQLAAQPQRTVYVYRQCDTVRAETTIAGRRAYLKRIYVTTHRVLVVPTVRYIELFGVDAATGEEVSEKVNSGGGDGNMGY